METAKSLSFDPANHSAHRFLSDTYANTPRHEIARVSELLQAQLLQPINVNPVQPHMAVADLNIITNTGPSAIGFNEFAPLMERNKPQLVTSGIVGSNNTLGDEIVASALYGRGSISIGQFHYETIGFRRNNNQPDMANNNDLKHNIYNVFMQYAITPRLNIQAELNTRKTEHGDVLMQFDRDNYNQFQRFGINQDKARIGARYAISSNQDVIVSAALTNREKVLDNQLPKDSPFNVSSTDSTKEISYQTEVQYLLRQEYLNITAGGGAYRVDTDRLIIENGPQLSNPNRVTTTPIKDYRNDRDNAYIYSNINFPRSISTTLGLSYDWIHVGRKIKGYDSTTFNPKFGFQWDITGNLRFRAAWFETVRSALVASQTIEPTQVAGFNQFFDDVAGTKSRRKGAGLDVRITNNLYSGFEISERKITIPSVIEGKVYKNDESDQIEKLYRTYLYWLPHSNWTIKGELQNEKLAQLTPQLTEDYPNRIDTLSASIGLKYFNPNGMLGGLTGTHVEQELGADQTPDSKFFLLDASIGYRFPNRRGIISFDVRNFLDQKFRYWSSYLQNNDQLTAAPRFTPGRTFFLRLTLNF